MKKLLSLIFAISVVLGACGTTQTQLAPSVETSTPKPASAVTQTPFPSTASITPIPTFFHPFPSTTPNATAISIAQKLGAYSVMLSTDEIWAAASYVGKLKVVQVNRDKEFEVTCEYFAVCELIIPIAWSPDSKMLYFASLITGESLIPFDLYAGMARFNTQNQQFEKVVEDSLSDLEYNASLSPDGAYFVYSDTKNSTPFIKVLDTRTLDHVAVKQIDSGLFAGDILWTQSSNEILFVSLVNCESSVYQLKIKEDILSKLVNNDPSCISLLFKNEKHQIALSKSTYYPITKSYWYLDLFTKELTPILPTP